MKRQLVILAVAGSCLIATACDQKPKPPASASGAVEPVENATINEIMKLQAEPAADVIWESVKTVSDATGVHEYRPATDAEWAAVAQSARTLIGVAQMITQEGRPLIRPGVQMEEGGTLDAPAIQAMIAANRPAFVQKAGALDAAARVALAAIEARDADRLMEAGGPIDEACEGCHTQFYYPEAPAK